MNRFPDHSRVVFIGDSITAAGMWIAHVYDYYLRNFPDADIRFFNAGIAGGSTKSTLKYFDENIMIYRPTHAVIMLGMNDVARNRYDIDNQGKHIYPDHAFRWNPIAGYESGMRTIIERLQNLHIGITLLTPTCYDESTNVRQIDKAGCDAALEYAGEIMRRLAVEYGCEFVNFHAPFCLINAAQTMIQPDRVHPLESGHIVMAQLFLHAQGLVEEPTPVNFHNLPQTLDLLPENQARFEAEQKVRMLWKGEWVILRDQPKDFAVRRTCLETYEPPYPSLNELRHYCLEYGDRLEEFTTREIALCDACAAQSAK